MRIIYVDDSGNEDCTLLTALSVPEWRWSSYLRGCLTRRKQLFRDHLVPADYELHAFDWLSNSPAPYYGPDGGIPTILQRGAAMRRSRVSVFEGALRLVATFADARMHTVYAPDTRKADLYGLLVDLVDQDLAARDEFGLVILDGLDLGGHFRAQHRNLKLASRRIIEDPMPCASSHSQFIQMVDFCVHAAFRHVRNDPNELPKLQRIYHESLSPIIVPASAGVAGILGWDA